MEQTKQQTALDLFIAALKEWKVESSSTDYDFKIPAHIFNHMEKRAKQMEKKQIIDAVDWGNRKGYDEHTLTVIYDLDEQYYNETYGKTDSNTRND